MSLGGDQLVQRYIVAVDPGRPATCGPPTLRATTPAHFTNARRARCLAHRGFGRAQLSCDHSVRRAPVSDDANGVTHFFVTGYYNEAVIGMDAATGVNISGNAGFTLLSAAISDSVAVDGSGNLWVDTLTDARSAS